MFGNSSDFSRVLLCGVVAFCLFGEPESSFCQQYLVTTRDGRGADATVRGLGDVDRSDVNYGAEPTLLARWNPGTSEPHNDKFWFRIDLAGLPRPIPTAQLDLYWNRVADVTATYDVYGLRQLDDYSINFRTGEPRLNEFWPEESITWNNAPGNRSGLADNDVDLAVYLFSFTNPRVPGTVSVPLGQRRQRLIEFLNDDTNDVVTFIVRKSVAQTFLGNFAGKEADSDVAHPPRLALDYGTLLVPPAGSWQFYDGASDPGSLWRQLAFDDGAWKSGVGEFGYGDGDESTFVSCGPDLNCSQNNRATVLFRKIIDLSAFGITEVARVNELRAEIQRDDAAAVYVNGIEVFRDANLSSSATFNSGSSAVFVGASADVGHLRRWRGAFSEVLQGK